MFSEDAIETYLQSLYSDNWQDILKQWMQDEAWWGLLGMAQAGDTLYRYVYDGSGKPSIDVFQFQGQGKILLTGLSAGQGTHTDVGLHNMYTNKGVGLVGIHINKNIGVELLGTTAGMSVWFHRVTWTEDRMVDGVRSVIGMGIGGVIGGPVGGGVGFLVGMFSDDLGGNYPGTVEDDYVLRVHMGRRQGNLLWSFEVDQSWRVTVQPSVPGT